VIEALSGVSAVVEDMQVAIGSGPRVLGRPLSSVVPVFTAPVHLAIRAAARLVGSELDAALEKLAPLLRESVPGAGREAALAVLNGVVGHHLAATGNPLAIEMRLRRGSRALDLEGPASVLGAVPDARGKVLVLLHGSCLCDRAWAPAGQDRAEALARELGFTCLRLSYNTGRHISENGAELAGLLERLVASWPVPLDELVLLGHSMGGLVARSACRSAEDAGHAWRARLAALVCVASPHHGAALERGGSFIDALLGVSRHSAPLARLGKIRSAGVTDLRYGNVLDAHWRGRDRFAAGGGPPARLDLPRGVACYAVAATRTAAPGEGPYASDGLVSVDSALGRHRRPELSLGFPEAHQWIGFGMGHLEVLGRPELYEVLRSWLSARGCPSSAESSRATRSAGDRWARLGK
jgi:pimeloyl-ACP methyl ester carboxylesterase